MDFKQVRQEFRQEFVDEQLPDDGSIGYLEEAGMSRMISLMDKKPFIMVTAFRNEFSLADNRKRNNALLRTLNQLKMGPHLTRGFWDEAPDGMDYDEAKKKDLLIRVSEESFLAPIPKDMDVDEFKALAIRLIKRANVSQDAVIFSDGKTVYNLFKSGKMEKLGTKTTLNNIGDIYSVWRKRPKLKFTFEGVIQPANISSRILFTEIGLNWFRGL